jgi:uncharacterized protein (DUF2235 family)
MAKRIAILSDGTGQAGGANPTDWTSVYRLHVNIRDAAPAAQISFYDPGLGSDPDQREAPSLLSSLGQWLAKGLGAGITRNIVDCYMAALLTHEPGDRIYLFGFSRGAYTVRSMAGVLGLCGVPPGLPKVALGHEIRARLSDPAIRAVAEEAVTQVYMTYHDRELRLARAAAFRAKHGSVETPPFFIGVWDTVRALGWQVTDVARFGRHRFHDAVLNARVAHGRQALSIDDNRKVFAPELWDQRAAPAGQIAQVWFAGDHTDVGGGHGLKRGLTDIAMKWMVDEAIAARPAAPDGLGPLAVDQGLFDELNLDPLGMQHDPRGSLTGLLWWPGTREAYVEAPQLAGPAAIHPSVEARFKAADVPVDGRRERYRPEALRHHPTYGAWYLGQPSGRDPAGGG